MHSAFYEQIFHGISVSDQNLLPYTFKNIVPQGEFVIDVK